MTRKCNIINIHIYKNYSIRPKIPQQQMFTNQPTNKHLATTCLVSSSPCVIHAPVMSPVVINRPYNLKRRVYYTCEVDSLFGSSTV
jgi:hypothetical protein